MMGITHAMTTSQLKLVAKGAPFFFNEYFKAFEKKNNWLDDKKTTILSIDVNRLKILGVYGRYSVGETHSPLSVR